MIKKLRLVLSYLSSMGLTEEAEHIRKISAPIIEDGLVRIDSNHGSASTVNPIAETGMSKRYRSYDKDGISGYDPEDWFKSVSGLGDKIVLIVFKEEDVSSDFFRRIVRLFKGDSYNFSEGKPTYSETSRLIGSFGEDSASMEKFFEEFPEVKSLFDKMPEVKSNAAELEDQHGEDYDSEDLYENFLIILMGEEAYSTGGLASIYKSPNYLAHDIGHMSMDWNDSSSLKYSLESLMHSLCSLYRDEDEELNRSELDDAEEESEDDSEEKLSMLEDLKDFSGQDEYEFWHSVIPHFFSTSNSNYNDTYPDIFANLASQDFNYDIPNRINGDNHSWIISEDNKSEAERMIKEFIEEQTSEISDGVLEDHYGSVIFI